MCEELSIYKLGKEDRALENHYITTENCLPARILFGFFLFFTLAHGFLFLIHIGLLVKEYLQNPSWHPRKRIISFFTIEFLLNFFADLSCLLSFPFYVRYFFFGIASLPTSLCTVLLLRDWFTAFFSNDLIKGKNTMSLQGFHRTLKAVMAIEILSRIGAFLAPVLAFNDLRLANILTLVFQIITYYSGAGVGLAGVFLTKKVMKMTKETFSHDQAAFRHVSEKLRNFKNFCLSSVIALIVLGLGFLIWMIVSSFYSYSGMDYVIFFVSPVRLMVFTSSYQFLQIHQSASQSRTETKNGSKGNEEKSNSVSVPERDSMREERPHRLDHLALLEAHDENLSQLNNSFSYAIEDLQK